MAASQRSKSHESMANSPSVAFEVLMPVPPHRDLMFTEHVQNFAMILVVYSWYRSCSTGP